MANQNVIDQLDSIYVNCYRKIVVASGLFSSDAEIVVKPGMENFFVDYPNIKSEFINLYSDAIQNFVDWQTIFSQALTPSLLTAALSVGLIYLVPSIRYYKIKKEIKNLKKLYGDVKPFEKINERV